MNEVKTKLPNGAVFACPPAAVPKAIPQPTHTVAGPKHAARFMTHACGQEMLALVGSKQGVRCPRCRETVRL